MTVSETVSTIQTRTRDDGLFGTSRNGNLKDTVQDLKNLSPAERGEALSDGRGRQRQGPGPSGQRL